MQQGVQDTASSGVVQGYPVVDVQAALFFGNCQVNHLGCSSDRSVPLAPAAAAVPGVLTDAEEAGVKSATVYAAMMGDGEEPESKERGAWLDAFVAKIAAANTPPSTGPIKPAAIQTPLK